MTTKAAAVQAARVEKRLVAKFPQRGGYEVAVYAHEKLILLYAARNHKEVRAYTGDRRTVKDIVTEFSVDIERGLAGEQYSAPASAGILCQHCGVHIVWREGRGWGLFDTADTGPTTLSIEECAPQGNLAAWGHIPEERFL